MCSPHHCGPRNTLSPARKTWTAIPPAPNAASANVSGGPRRRGGRAGSADAIADSLLRHANGAVGQTGRPVHLRYTPDIRYSQGENQKESSERRRQRDEGMAGATTRDSILDAAEQLIARDGVQHLTIGRVAE